ncbi:MAG: N-acetylneuraminate synthase family protein [Myxococcales bacterium]|nr:N-acetylneuraminate synthase family protein [Myxococcales bacterium]
MPSSLPTPATTPTSDPRGAPGIPELLLGDRRIGAHHPPLVIPELGINHEGDLRKARRMIDDAAEAGAECVKLQCHVLEDEMTAEAREVIPGNADESIWEIMRRAALSEVEERSLMEYAQERGLLFLSTPFSRAAADRLEAMGVSAFKIGSGECNNTPLIDHIASFGKPILLSTGMNDLRSIAAAVEILERREVPYGLLHCTSIYPTPYPQVRLGALESLARAFPRAVLGSSDHSLGIYTALAAIPLGARVLEKHFTSDSSWSGPDVPLSITPPELRELVRGARAIFESLGGEKEILEAEQPTIDFAYASVVTIAPIAEGELLSEASCWVKRPGNGEIRAAELSSVLGRRARRDLPAGAQLRWSDLR